MALCMLLEKRLSLKILMRTAFLTPMRLLSGIVILTILCMFSIAVVTDHLADICLSDNPLGPSSRVHLINNVTVALKRAEDNRAAYLATGNASYLKAYDAACADVDSSMDRLVNEDTVVTTKLAHAQGLRQFLHDKLTQIGQALAFKPKAAAAPVIAQPVLAKDGDLSRIQKLLDSLAQEETRDVSGGLDAARARSIFHRNLVLALAAINILFLSGVAFCATQIGKLHSLVTMCAWSKRVEYEGKWIPLEEYMHKRLGVRISHGISQEEYDKWKVAEMDGQSQAEMESYGAVERPPKAAA